MSQKSFDLFNSQNSRPIYRNRLRWYEWGIAILFIISLLIGSGVFVRASDAADGKLKKNINLALGSKTVIQEPRGSGASPAKNRVKVLNMSMDALDDNSCELKP